MRDTNATINQKRILTVCEILKQKKKLKENPNNARDTNKTINQKKIITVREILTKQLIKRMYYQCARY